jgi:hypothetical protein
VITEAGTELKENPVAEMGVAEDVSRLLTLTPDGGMVDSVCVLTPVKVGDRAGGKEAEDAADENRGEFSADPGLEGRDVEHAEPVTVNVTVESKRTVLMPSAPVDVKADGPFGTVGCEAVVNAGSGDDARATLVGTIPPKLNVLADDADSNCRLFSLMTDGEAEGTLRLMIEGSTDACGGLTLLP